MRTSALPGCVRALTQLRERTCTAVQDEGAHDGERRGVPGECQLPQPTQKMHLQQRLQALHVKRKNSESGMSG